jgi:hypothetical protein
MSISATMVAALANVKPYLHSSDGTLAQLCQAALTFTMSIGLLEMAAESFQDAYYGPILVVCTTAQFAVSFIAIGFEWALSQFPEMFRKAGRLIGLSSSDPQNDIIAPRRLKNSFLRKTKVNAIAPVQSSAPNPKEEGATNLSEENRDAVIVLCVDNEEVSTGQSAMTGPPTRPTDPQNDIIAPRRLKNSFLRKTKANAIAPVQSSAPNPKEEGATNLSEESQDAVIVLCVDNEEVSTGQSAMTGPPTRPTDPQNDIIAPRRLKNSFLRKTKVNAIAPVQSSAPNPKEEGATNLSEESRDAVIVLCVDNEEVPTGQGVVSGPPVGPTESLAKGVGEDLNNRTRSLVSRKMEL